MRTILPKDVREEAERLATQEIDWGDIEGPPRQTMICSCRGIWRSHGKGRWIGERFVVITKSPCPVCGVYAVTEGRSDPEVFEVG